MVPGIVPITSGPANKLLATPLLPVSEHMDAPEEPQFSVTESTPAVTAATLALSTLLALALKPVI